MVLQENNVIKQPYMITINTFLKNSCVYRYTKTLPGPDISTYINTNEMQYNTSQS